MRSLGRRDAEGKKIQDVWRSTGDRALYRLMIGGQEPRGLQKLPGTTAWSYNALVGDKKEVDAHRASEVDEARLVLASSRR